MWFANNKYSWFQHFALSCPIKIRKFIFLEKTANMLHRELRLSNSQTPAFSVLAFHKLIGFVKVYDLHTRAIPV
jgi:hypothetical protein